MVTDQPAMPPEAKVAHMYPGQGSQYVGMTHDLWQRFTAVQDVWRLADETMVEVLDGETLSSFVLRSNLSKEEIQDAEAKLKRTEIHQPAMLTADLAIERALNDTRPQTRHGRRPFAWRICGPDVGRHHGHGQRPSRGRPVAPKWARLKLTIRA